ncbi:hypothetical protein AJ79_01377 [Helicocarpus griseus UAMH5409]|uniref:Arabinan endo-1,5-alpha-L-arabinosidase n=1 Tax=Helicocarpus griseus UAMH5409 TaxID=1447875 RepID=A0A2B7Y7I0_9EURO|nr:hypothetical protein AJ79_01377 [Helicocarpus griseus UAMH5409]
MLLRSFPLLLAGFSLCFAAALRAEPIPHTTDLSAVDFLPVHPVHPVHPAHNESLPIIESRDKKPKKPKPSKGKDKFPLAIDGNVRVRDPSILKDGDYYYLFGTGPSTPWHRAKKLTGPWEKMGTVLDGPSVIEKKDRKTPWAPHVIKKGDTFYCYYSVSFSGKRDSAIGIATTKKLKKNKHWKDHGALIQTGSGPGSDVPPFDTSNAIDPMVFFDKDDKPRLIYGSFFSGLYQLPLDDDLMSLPNPKKPKAKLLAKSRDKTNIEGPFVNYRKGYYYFWFSHGICCKFDKDFEPKNGPAYSIRVGRSKDIRGPFVDKDGKNLTKGGGHVVYGSNHDKKVLAPGGQGILAEGKEDILYYHYLNKEVGKKYKDGLLGFNRLKYVDGWPEVSDEED